MALPSQSPVVCDADAASFIIKDDSVRSPRYLRHLQGRPVVLPFSVVAELRLGAVVRNWGPPRRARMEHFIGNCVVHCPDDGLCSVWAILVAERRRTGHPISQHDGWVAAVALYLQAPLVTHNAGHYRGIPNLPILTEPDF